MRDLERVAKDLEACRRVIDSRLALVEAYGYARDAGCNLPPYPARMQSYLVEVARCIDALPPGVAYSRSYARMVELAPRLMDDGPTRCVRLALLRALRRWIPDAQAPTLAAMRDKVPIGRCGSGKDGSFDVPEGFAAWAALGQKRAPNIARVRSHAAQSPIPVVGSADSRRGAEHLTIDVRVNGELVRALVDTGGVGYLALDPPAANRLQLPVFATGEFATPCMDCPAVAVGIGWIDRLEIGNLEIDNVPFDALNRHGAEPLIIGPALIRQAGGMSIGAGPDGRGVAVYIGPDARCADKLEAELGAQGRLFVTSDLGGYGSKLLMLDTGLVADYALWQSSVGAVPRGWSHVSHDANEDVYVVLSFPGQGGAPPSSRTVRIFRDDGPQPVFLGSDGWIGHAAFAPGPVCIDFEKPALSVGSAPG